jgi:hypothetical protein
MEAVENFLANHHDRKSKQEKGPTRCHEDTERSLDTVYIRL